MLMIARIKNYLHGINLEWQKVSKPDAKEVQASTITVIVGCALLGLFIFLVDGNAGTPAWSSPIFLLLLVVLPVAVFSVARTWETRRTLATVVACAPLVFVLVSQFALSLEAPFGSGFGLAFLRALFIRSVE